MGTTSIDATMDHLAGFIVRELDDVADGSHTPPADDDAATYRYQLATEITPPSDDTFKNAEEDFLDSHPMTRLGEQLVDDWPELSHIKSTRVAYAWRKRGGTKGSKPVLGRCVALSGHAKHYAAADFLIVLSADATRDLAFGPGQFEALLYSELCHIGWTVDQDESSASYGEVTIKAVPHDFEGFWSEIERYPGWREELRQTENTFQQARLLLETIGDSAP